MPIRAPYARGIGAGSLQQRRESEQRTRRATVTIAHRTEGALPDAQQRSALRDAGAAGDGAGRRGVEFVVEGREVFGVTVGGEEVREGCAGEGGEGEVEEVLEGVRGGGVGWEGLVVGEVGF